MLDGPAILAPLTQITCFRFCFCLSVWQRLCCQTRWLSCVYVLFEPIDLCLLKPTLCVTMYKYLPSNAVDHLPLTGLGNDMSNKNMYATNAHHSAFIEDRLTSYPSSPLPTIHQYDRSPRLGGSYAYTYLYIQTFLCHMIASWL